MRILITGAFGYVGYSVIEKLVQSENELELVLFDNLSRNNLNLFHRNENLNSPKIKAIFFNDILDNYHLKKALKGVDIVIHLAANVSTPFSNQNLHAFDQINNWGTACLTAELSNSNSVKHLIYLSSIAVYGNTAGKTVDESVIPVPKTHYGISKLHAEKHIQILNEKIKTTIIRSGNIYGYNPCFRIQAVINKFMFDAHYKNKIQIESDGEQKRAFTSISAVADLIGGIITEKRETPNLFNLVEQNFSINQISDEIEKFYPEIERIYSIQHLKMRSVSVESKHKFEWLNSKSFDQSLIDIKNNFHHKT